MRTRVVGAMLLALGSLASAPAASETDADLLTSDQQAYVALAIRDDLRRPANKKKVGRGGVACLSAKIDEGKTTSDGDTIMRTLRIPGALLAHLSSDGARYVVSDACVVRENEKIRLAGDVQTPATLLEIEISDATPTFARIAVGVSTAVCDADCKLTDTYAASKTKRGWSLVHEGHIDE